MYPFTGKKIAVLGAGKSGLSAALLLKRWGSYVFVSEKGHLDSRKKELLRERGISFEDGGHSSSALCSDLIVTSPGVPPSNPILLRARRTGIPVISELELGWSWLEGKTFAVTGTNGKSTVVSWTAHILKEIGAIACGNVGNPMASLKSTERGPFIIEVSSFQLSFTKRFRPDVAVILNLSEDHLDWHGSFEDYRLSKLKIYMNQRREDWLLLNHDDELFRSLSDFPSRPLFFSVREEVRGAYLKGRTIFLNLDRPIPILDIDSLPTRGIHNVSNALVVALLSYLGGASLETIRRGLRSFSPLPHRLEYVGKVGEVEIFNDSKATNPHAVLAALQAFKGPLVLILGGRTKGTCLEDLISEVSGKVEGVVVFGEMKNQMSTLMVTDGPKIFLEDTVQEALSTALNILERGVILFSPGGSSFDQFRDYKERGEKFKDAVKRTKITRVLG